MAEAQDDCILCAIIAGDLPSTMIDSDEHTVAFMDINPATPGHAGSSGGCLRRSRFVAASP